MYLTYIVVIKSEVFNHILLGTFKLFLLLYSLTPFIVLCYVLTFAVSYIVSLFSIIYICPLFKPFFLLWSLLKCLFLLKFLIWPLLSRSTLVISCILSIL